MTIWTYALAQACEAVARDYTTLPHRDELLRDIRSRAREFRAQSIGIEMTRTQSEYFQCLRSRLETNYLPTHKALNDAWIREYAR
jgi:hypothetical protein